MKRERERERKPEKKLDKYTQTQTDIQTDRLYRSCQKLTNLVDVCQTDAIQKHQCLLLTPQIWFPSIYRLCKVIIQRFVNMT